MLADVYGNSAPSYRTVTKRVAQFMNPTRAFEDAPRSGRLTTVLIDESIRAVEEVVMRDRWISLRHIVVELSISKTLIYQIMSDYLGMKKVCTRWVKKLFTPLQPAANRADCCEELLENCNQDPTGLFLVVLWREMRHGCITTIHSANKKQRPARNQAKRHQSDYESHDWLARSSWPSSGTGKLFFSSIFYHVVLPINSPYYASVLHRLCSSIREKCRGKLRRGELLPHDSAPVSQVQHHTGFNELNYRAYSPDIASRDYHGLKGEAFSSRQKFWDRWWSGNDWESLFEESWFFSRYRKLTWLIDWCDC